MNSMANNYKCAVFDLDGTLINTITDLANTTEYIMKRHGFEAHWSEADYKSFVGNGIKKLIERAFRHTLSEQELEDYFSEFKEYYNIHMLDNTKPYDGITEQLKILRDNGIKMCVITNKAEPAAIGLIEQLFGKGLFDIIIGQRDGLALKPAPDGVFAALEALSVKQEEAIYFGDSNVDMQTAKNASLTAVGVTWGFRSKAELEKEGANIIIDSPARISELF